MSRQFEEWVIAVCCLGGLAMMPVGAFLWAPLIVIGLGVAMLGMLIGEIYG